MFAFSNELYKFLFNLSMETARIRKRTGRIVPFNKNKVVIAISRAFSSVGRSEEENVQKVAEFVFGELKKKYDGGIISVEQVQDAVEQALIKKNFADVAKAYILYRQKHKELREMKSLMGDVDDDLKLPINSFKVLKARYLQKDEEGKIIETPRQLFTRVAKAIAEQDARYGVSEEDIKATTRKFFRMMTTLEFLPNSPTLFNAGTDKGLSLSACFVLPVGDAMEDIFDAVKYMALVQKSGGGTGFSFSRLRPKGYPVRSTRGVASGPLSFMRVFNVATDVIKQGGKRRGANMGVMRVDHPDIIDFISCKEKESEMTNFNLSVGITDDFMKAVENGENYYLRDPKTRDPVGQLNARKVFSLITTFAWKNGDPGIIFLDEINRHNPTPEIGEIEATNPCVSADTLIMTRKGYVPIGKMVGHKAEIWTGYEWSEVVPRITGENQQLMRISFSDGSHVDCTPYHKFYIEKGTARNSKVSIVEAKNLDKGMKLQRFSYPVTEGEVDMDTKIAYTAGFFCGDGSAESNRDRKSLWLYGAKRELVDNFSLESINECADNKLFIKLDRSFEWDKRFVPDGTYTIQTRLDWLAGLLDADSGYNGNGSYSIHSVIREFLQNVKHTLHTLGVGATLSLSKEAQLKNMPNGHGGSKEYKCLDSWRLTISGYSMMRLVEAGLCTHRIDTSYIVSRECNRFITIDRIEAKGVADKVYCFTESKSHRGMFGCVSLGQCGEQPLLPYESCNLGSINLAKMLRETENGYEMDWKRLKSTVQDAVHFLDNVIDANMYPIPEIEKASRANRKIGLGIMGFADTLILLEIPYSSEQAEIFASKVMSFIQETALEVSIAMGKERGNFPNFNRSIFKENFPSMRNATVTTIAPTGTIGIIASASSGIEPLFAISYLRKVGNTLGEDLIETNPIFEEVLKKRNLYTEELMRKVAGRESIQDIAEIPEDIRKIFVSAHNITPEWHLRIQAAIQKHVDNAVSKTINLSNSATIQDIEDIYLRAWKMGCKGVTVYRNNSRSEQILNFHDSSKKMPEAAQVANPTIAVEEHIRETPKDICPNCGSKMMMEEGCMNCKSCGYSVCG
jgi:ribonucleoside-diphosphate reductase alpha chain